MARECPVCKWPQKTDGERSNGTGKGSVMAMGKAKRKQLAKLTACQDCRELAIAFKQDVQRYQGEIPVHVLLEHRAARLEGLP